MSLDLILMMAASRASATFIGFDLGLEDEDVITLPVGAAAGDYMVVTYFSGRMIAGGSGTAFNTFSFTNMKVSHRLLEANDLTTPITLDSPSPFVVGVWRGPTGISSARSSMNGAAQAPNVLPGFMPSAQAVAIVTIGHCEDSDVSFAIPPMENRSAVPSSGFGYGMAQLTNVAGYGGGDINFSTALEAIGEVVAARSYELTV